MKVSNGMCHFYLPSNVKVRSDGTLPHLPPLTKKDERGIIYKYIWNQPYEGTR